MSFDAGKPPIASITSSADEVSCVVKMTLPQLLRELWRPLNHQQIEIDRQWQSGSSIWQTHRSCVQRCFPARPQVDAARGIQASEPGSKSVETHSAASSIVLTDACRLSDQILPLQQRGQQQACSSRGRYSTRDRDGFLHREQCGSGDRWLTPSALSRTSMTHVQRRFSVSSERQQTKRAACLEVVRVHSEIIGI